MSPVSLYPKQDLSIMDKIEIFLLKHSDICLLICCVIMFILVTVLICEVITLVCQIFGIFITDSGLYYNHLKDVV